MSSADFKKVLITDSRLLVNSEISYGVYKGAQQMTPYTANATSQSVSQVSFNVQLPQDVVVDRRVLWHSTVTFGFSSTAAPTAGSYAFSYGMGDALAPWPLHNLCTTMACTINSNTVTINAQDVVPQLARLYDSRSLSAYNGSTPLVNDYYCDYNSGINAGVSSQFNVLGDGVNSLLDRDLPMRGAYPYTTAVNPASVINVPFTAGTSYITFDIVEPLMLSPWMFTNSKVNVGGLVGVQQLTFVFNLDATCKRVWRTSGFVRQATGVANESWAAIGMSVTLTGCTNNYLEFNWLTPNASTMIPRRSVVPYYEAINYSITNSAPTIGPGNLGDLVSQTVTLNQIPDKLMVQVRKPKTSLTYSDSDWAFVITKLSISFNNNTGLLSSAKPEDLYRYSREAGSNLSWFEFTGATNSRNNGTNVNAAVSTVGSFLILDFGKHIPLANDYEAPGLLGNYTLQLQMTVKNQSAVALTPEISIVVINSGIFITEAGSASCFTGILDKQSVLEASSQPGYGSIDAERMVGGANFLDMLKGSVAKVLPKLPSVAKSALSSMDDPRAKKGAEVLGQLGYGVTGAGLTGAGKPRFAM